MAKLEAVARTVRGILERCPEARDSDDLLYCKIINIYGAGTMDVLEFFRRRKSMGIPSFETVRRSRQKVQEEHPELKGTRAEERAEAEQVFRDFAKN